MLQNTYAFAFFLPVDTSAEKVRPLAPAPCDNLSSTSQNLFEYLQANLEATTEKLTELTEMPLEKISADQLVNYTRATKKVRSVGAGSHG